MKTNKNMKKNPKIFKQIDEHIKQMLSDVGSDLAQELFNDWSPCLVVNSDCVWMTDEGENFVSFPWVDDFYQSIENEIDCGCMKEDPKRFIHLRKQLLKVCKLIDENI